MQSLFFESTHRIIPVTTMPRIRQSAPSKSPNQVKSSPRWTIDCCLYQWDIPVELRRIIQAYIFKSLDNQTIVRAVYLWFTNQRCALDEFGHISDWKTTGVTHMSRLFENRWLQDSIDQWDVSNVTTLARMFSGATKFNQPLASWNIGRVVDMSSMFSGAKAFNQPLNDWDTRAVTNTNGMFVEAVSFNQPLNKWNICSLRTMRAMFNGASKFNNSLNEWNTESVQDVGHMFSGATQFNQPVHHWNTSSMTNTEFLFYASGFNQSISTWSIQPTCNTTKMFEECPLVAYCCPPVQSLQGFPFSNEYLRSVVHR